METYEIGILQMVTTHGPMGRSVKVRENENKKYLAYYTVQCRISVKKAGLEKPVKWNLIRRKKIYRDLGEMWTERHVMAPHGCVFFSGL